MRSRSRHSGKPDAGKLARPVWGWGPGAIPETTPLLIGSIPGGERASDMMTLVSSAIRNDLHVWSYVKGILAALLSGCTDCDRTSGATEHSDQIRTYRVDERRDKADRKQRQRAQRRARCQPLKPHRGGQMADLYAYEFHVSIQ
jgi:hypothetical protein